MMPKSHYAVDINYVLLQTPKKLIRSCDQLIVFYTMLPMRRQEADHLPLQTEKMSCSSTPLSTHTAVLACGDIRTKEYIFVFFCDY
jgi:hypothetical protein